MNSHHQDDYSADMQRAYDIALEAGFNEPECVELTEAGQAALKLERLTEWLEAAEPPDYEGTRIQEAAYEDGFREALDRVYKELER